MAAAVQRLSSRFNGLLTQRYNTIRGAKIVPTKNSHKPKLYYTYSLEPSQPLPRNPKWTTGEEAVQCIKSGDTVFLSGAASTPIDLAIAMTEYGKCCGLKDVTVCHMHTEGDAPYTDPSCEGLIGVDIVPKFKI